MKEQDELAETILALPGHNLSVSNGDEMLILDLETLQSIVREWKEMKRRLAWANTAMTKICAVDGIYGKQIAMAYLELNHPAFAAIQKDKI